MNTRGPYYQIRRKILFKYLEDFPGAPSNQLAKMLTKDAPEYFKDKEHARSLIRLYRGKNGVTSRSKKNETKYFQI